ncbi:MAG TPA: hypothetical protein VF267_13210 [Gammaproteobacteria bacterium]
MVHMKKNLLRLAGMTVGLLVALPALAETYQDVKEHKFSAAEVTELSVLNLAGSVLLKGSNAREIVVKATFFGEARDAEKARDHAGLLSLAIETEGKRVGITTVYPVNDYDEYIYQRDGDGDGGLFGWGSNTTTTYMDERVSVRSGGDGLAVHVDYEILVPEGVTVTFDNKVGAIRAENVDGKLRLDTSSGAIAISGGSGDVVADTGSGEIDVSDRTGNVSADTGSGAVTVQKVKGNVDADTGSGGVDVRDVTGDVRADTGSGGVDMENITGSIWADTGSGGVDGRNLQNVRELEVDTGSGSAELEGDFSKLERLMIDTGSGGVRMKTHGTLNMHLTVSAGSGGVRVDLPEMKNVRTGRGEFEATIGNGKGRGVIDTGSGGVRITSQ